MALPQEGLCVCTPQKTARTDTGHLGVTATTLLPRPPVTAARTSLLLLLISHLLAGSRGLALALHLRGPERPAEGKPCLGRDAVLSQGLSGCTARRNHPPPPRRNDGAKEEGMQLCTGQNQASSTVTGGRWPRPLRMHTPGQPPGTLFSGLGQVSCWPPLCHTVPSSESSNVRNQMQSSYPAPAPSQDHRQKGLLGEGQWAKRGQVGGPAIRGPGTLTTQKSRTKGPFAKFPRVRAWEFWSSQEESRGALASMP